MADNEELDQFFREFLECIISIGPQPDVVHHVEKLRRIIDAHKERDQYAEKLSQLNDTELHAIVRFVEKPHGRHHIAEIEEMLKELPPREVGEIFLKHLKIHEAKHFLHHEAFKHL